jgi:hypothetical protein
VKRTLAQTPDFVVVGALRIPRAAALAWALEEPAEGPDVFHVTRLDTDMRGQAQHIAAIVWQALEREVLARFLEHAPGTRPNPWWWIVARRHGLRRMLTGRGTPIAWSCRRGVPENYLDRDEPIAHESEAAYLQRHALLLPGEADRLPAGAFDPVPWVHPVTASLERARGK